MFESIIGSLASETNFNVWDLLASVGTALILGLIISIVYRKTHSSKTPSHAFSLALVVLAAIVAVIILLVGNSVARAFSLAGAFQIIRFRSAVGSAKDITFVLFSMAVGLCCGMGFILYGALSTVLLCGVMVVLEVTKYGKKGGERKLLKITIPEDLDYSHVFDDILGNYTSFYKQTRVKTKDLGSLFELQYSITEKGDMDEKAFIDELRCRNGNLNIALLTDANDSEF
jgi:hypothetical protein